MSRIPFRHHALAAAVLAVLPGSTGCTAAQPPPGSDGGAEPAGGDAGLTCEVYCSETRLGTANVRLSWIGPAVLAAAAEPAAEQLQTTVYKGGFDRDLYASFPVTGETSEPQAPSERRPAPELPAYDLKILEVQRPADSPAARTGEAPRTTVELEGLEPGMKYTWRVVFETAAGRQVSETVTCEAPVCTADQADGGPGVETPGY